MSIAKKTWWIEKDETDWANAVMILGSSDDCQWAGSLKEEWYALPSDQRHDLRKEIESWEGMVIYADRHQDYVRREADFLKNFKPLER